MRNNYDSGFDNRYEIIDAEFKKLSPYWVYAVADRTWLGLDPVHTFVAAFKDKDDAEAFINYRKSHVRDGERSFEIKDFTDRGIEQHPVSSCVTRR